MKRAANIPRNLSIVLLILVVGASAMWPVFFAGGSYIIKQNQAALVNNGAKKESYLVKTFTAKQVAEQGIANAKELTLNNVLYDVVSIEKQGGNYVYTLLCDNDETLLGEVFSTFTKNTGKQNNQKTVVAVFMFYFLNEKPEHANTFALTDKFYTGYIVDNIHPGYKSITSPPPKNKV